MWSRTTNVGRSVTRVLGDAVAGVGLGGLGDRVAEAEQLLEHPADPAPLQAGVLLPLGVRDAQVAQRGGRRLEAVGQRALERRDA